MEKFTNKKKENLHAGHRERMHRSFMTVGFDGFSDHQIIEMILYYTYPRRDTNELAHRLVNRFNGLAGVLDAPQECLLAEGITPRTVVLFKIFRDFYEAVTNNVSDEEVKKPVDDRVKKILAEKNDNIRGSFYAVYLDNGTGIIASEKLSDPSDFHNSMIQIVKSTVYHNSASTLLARNFTKDFPSVSEEDAEFAGFLSRYHAQLHLRFYDYLLVGKYSTISLRDSCYSGCFYDDN